MKQRNIISLFVFIILNSFHSSYAQSLKDIHNFKCHFSEGKSWYFEKEKPTILQMYNDKISDPVLYESVNYARDPNVAKMVTQLGQVEVKAYFTDDWTLDRTA